MAFPSLTPERAAAVLASAGIAVDSSALVVEPRDERWLVRLSGDRVAWFAASETGAGRLARERHVLAALNARCTFRVPRVIHHGDDVDVRAMVPGVADPWRLYDAVGADRALAARIGAAVGAILAEQHRRVRRVDVAGPLPDRPPWPRASDALRAALPRFVEDAALRDRVAVVLDAYDAVAVADEDRVLVHADLGLHNLAIDADTFAVYGVFDWDGAAWADRHHDFRYLIFHPVNDALLEAAIAVYEPAVGRSIDRGRVRLYNAAYAIGFLADRGDAASDDRPCGRTLAEDLAWTRAAVDAVLAGE
jgi:aminoglycoside phosphotransferase (APT) family kinase protein